MQSRDARSASRLPLLRDLLEDLVDNVIRGERLLTPPVHHPHDRPAGSVPVPFQGRQRHRVRHFPNPHNERLAPLVDVPHSVYGPTDPLDPDGLVAPTDLPIKSIHPYGIYPNLRMKALISVMV